MLNKHYDTNSIKTFYLFTKIVVITAAEAVGSSGSTQLRAAPAPQHYIFNVIYHLIFWSLISVYLWVTEKPLLEPGIHPIRSDITNRIPSYYKHTGFTSWDQENCSK